MSKAENKLAILQTSGQQINKLLGRSIVIFDHEGGQLSEPILFISDEQRFYDEETELAIVEWVLQNNHNAGATTKNFPDAQYLYFAVRVNERIYGVVGIDAMAGALDASEQSILLSILGETALALENEKNIREKEAAAILAESEQLRANLLRAISHDLRTPLTTISGNAGNLLHNSHSFDDETKQQIYADIYDDSMWLTNLVENLLYSTRIEEGRMMLKTSPELVSEIIEEAMQHIRPNAKKHSITVNYGDDLLMVRVDAKLIVQVIINLVDNALKYTPLDTLISISAECKNGMAEIKIADTGKGISDVEKGKIFDKFYSGEHKIADNRRSLGLGLYLCKAIVEAHGGSIHVTDNLPHGSVFRFTLPLEEVIIHEEISHNPDIILLDLGLPDIDGVEVIRRVRSWSNVPIIVISARAEDNDKIDALFYNAPTVAFTLILYGILFIIVENYNKHREPQVGELSDLTYKIALIIGCFQVLALIPGTSRSGATIIGAMILGTSRFVAAEYSFFLSIPVMFGASFLKLVKYGFHYTGMEVTILVVGMLVAFIVSIVAIKFLLGYIKKNDFKAFGVYRIVLGIVVAAYFLFVK